MQIKDSQPVSRVDFHCHSTASDGLLTPSELVARAEGEGVTALALTDHDTMAGLAEAREAASGHGLVFINGIELSCLWRNRTIHVVGLDFDASHPGMIEAINSQEQVRHERARTIDEKLSRAGLPPLLDDARALAKGVPGRPHFARAMLDRGLVSGIDMAFRRYLGDGRKGDVKACWPALETVTGWITAAGGVAVLAHPRKYRLTNVKLRSLIEDFRTAGGKGMEVVSAGQSPADTRYLGELALRFDCCASIGSDFHLPGQPWCELGRLPPLSGDLTPVWQRFRTVTRQQLGL